MIARTDNSGTVNAQVHGPVLKVGKPMTLTIRYGSTIR
jgi:hypothetical protein